MTFTLVLNTWFSNLEWHLFSILNTYSRWFSFTDDDWLRFQRRDVNFGTGGGLWNVICWQRHLPALSKTKHFFFLSKMESKTDRQTDRQRERERERKKERKRERKRDVQISIWRSVWQEQLLSGDAHPWNPSQLSNETFDTFQSTEPISGYPLDRRLHHFITPEVDARGRQLTGLESADATYLLRL